MRLGANINQFSTIPVKAAVPAEHSTWFLFFFTFRNGSILRGFNKEGMQEMPNIRNLCSTSVCPRLEKLLISAFCNEY